VVTISNLYFSKCKIIFYHFKHALIHRGQKYDQKKNPPNIIERSLVLEEASY